MSEDAAQRRDVAPSDMDAHAAVKRHRSDGNRIGEPPQKKHRHNEKGHHRHYRPVGSPSRERGDRAVGKQETRVKRGAGKMAKPVRGETSSEEYTDDYTPTAEPAPPPPPPPRAASSHRKAPVALMPVKEEHPKKGHGQKEKWILCKCGNWLFFKKLLKDEHLRCNRCNRAWINHLKPHEKEEFDAAVQARAEAARVAREREAAVKALEAEREEERLATQRRLAEAESNIRDLLQRLQVLEHTTTTQLIGTPAEYLASRARSKGMRRH